MIKTEQVDKLIALAVKEGQAKRDHANYLISDAEMLGYEVDTMTGKWLFMRDLEAAEAEFLDQIADAKADRGYGPKLRPA